MTVNANIVQQASDMPPDITTMVVLRFNIPLI
jgi:hypothetical protein